MTYPITPWSGAFNEHDWLGVMWAGYDRLCTGWETLDMPPHMEGDDAFQMLVEEWLQKDHGSPDFSLEFARRAGMLRVLNASRKERGRQQQDGEVVRRTFTVIDETFFSVTTASGDVWYLDREAEMKDELHTRLSACTQEQRDLLGMFYIEGYTTRELADAYGVDARTIERRLNAARSAAASVEI